MKQVYETGCTFLDKKLYLVVIFECDEKKLTVLLHSYLFLNNY